MGSSQRRKRCRPCWPPPGQLSAPAGRPTAPCGLGKGEVAGPLAAAPVAAAAAPRARQPVPFDLSSSTSGEAELAALSAAPASIGIAIGGFGRAGRQVARIGMKDLEVEPKLKVVEIQPRMQACAKDEVVTVAHSAMKAPEVEQKPINVSRVIWADLAGEDTDNEDQYWGVGQPEVLSQVSEGGQCHMTDVSGVSLELLDDKDLPGADALDEAGGKGATFGGATSFAINGIGRDRQQVARIAEEDPEVELKLIDAKASTKVPDIESMLVEVDKLVIGGGTDAASSKARGISVGNPSVEEDCAEHAKPLETEAKVTGVELEPLVSMRLEDGRPLQQRQRPRQPMQRQLQQQPQRRQREGEDCHKRRQQRGRQPQLRRRQLDHDDSYGGGKGKSQGSKSSEGGYDRYDSHSGGKGKSKGGKPGKRGCDSYDPAIDVEVHGVTKADLHLPMFATVEELMEDEVMKGVDGGKTITKIVQEACGMENISKHKYTERLRERFRKDEIKIVQEAYGMEEIDKYKETQRFWLRERFRWEGAG